MTDKANLFTPVAPRLPNAPALLDARFVTEQQRILALYFNQLDVVNAALLGRQGGVYLSSPHGGFSHSTTQALTAANTPYVVTLNTVDTAGGMTLATNRVTITQAGVYNYHYCLQLENTAAQIATVTVWLRKNGVDLPNSGSVWDVTSTHAGSNGYILATANFFVEVAGDDYLELVAAAGATGVNIEAYASSVSPFTRPSIPSTVVTIAFVSATPK